MRAIVSSLIVVFAGVATAFSPSSIGQLALRSNARATSSRTLRLRTERVPTSA